MPDENGSMTSSCDCGKKQAFVSMCIHVLFVSQYPDEFDSQLEDGEEPLSFLICPERGSLMFSVGSQSGSARHHSHKRTIVVYTGFREWKCQSCVKERYETLMQEPYKKRL